MKPRRAGKTSDIQIVSLAAPVRHALQGMAALAARPERGLDARSVARRLHLPEAALSKCFQRLAARGLLESRRGPGGGYRLARPPGSMSLASIAAALDLARARQGRCVLNDRPCSDKTACVIHHAAGMADARMKEALSRLTLADLVAPRKKTRVPPR